MQYRSFAELVGLDFRLDYLAAGQTIDRPFKYYRCTRAHRKFDRFFYIAGGEFRITQDGCEPLTLHAGDLIYLPNDCVYTSEWTSDEISYYAAEFILTDGGEPFSLSSRIFLALHEEGSVTLELMRRLAGVFRKGEVGYRIKAGSLFFELLHHVALENIRDGITKNHADISPAIFHLENNYISDVTVAELARLCGMCESRFRARFSEYAGMPPIKYRNLLRVKKARELLSSGEYTVGEAAELVGIPDIAYFNRVYKSFIGKNPSDAIGG